jgi:hypothetical protein
MKCIVCEKDVAKESELVKHDVVFCSDNCLTEYEKKLEELNGIIDWDNCC